MNSIKKLEKELVEIVNKDKQSWTHFYLVMKEIEENELWKEAGERSFTSWVKNFSIKNNVHESIIWNRKKAGQVYESYQQQKEEKGEEVVPLAKIDVAPESLVILDKINKKSPQLAEELTEKVMCRALTRDDLREAYKTIRDNPKYRVKEDKIPEKKGLEEATESNKEDNEEEHQEVTAALIVSALMKSEWLGVEKEKKHFKTAFEQDKYKCFTEFPLYTGTSKKSRRVDVLIAENLTEQPWELNLHGVEIKVSKSDLLRDSKYSEYANFVDFMWLAIPGALLKEAQDTKFDGCGILVINNKNEIEIVERAIRGKALKKRDTLTSIALKLL